jgi:hypothetical protein
MIALYTLLRHDQGSLHYEQYSVYRVSALCNRNRVDLFKICGSVFDPSCPLDRLWGRKQIGKVSQRTQQMWTHPRLTLQENTAIRHIRRRRAEDSTREQTSTLIPRHTVVGSIDLFNGMTPLNKPSGSDLCELSSSSSPGSGRCLGRFGKPRLKVVCSVLDSVKGSESSGMSGRGLLRVARLGISSEVRTPRGAGLVGFTVGFGLPPSALRKALDCESVEAVRDRGCDGRGLSTLHLIRRIRVTVIVASLAISCLRALDCGFVVNTT